MRTVELLPDDALDGAVRDVWRRLDAAGLPSLATHRHPTNRPHLTLASADQLAPGDVLDEALRTLPVGVRLEGLVFFEKMAVWLIVPDPALLALHAAVWRALGGADTNPLHAPGRWVPHISLARRVDPARRAAFEAVAGGPAMTGSFVGARSYDSADRTITPLTQGGHCSG